MMCCIADFSKSSNSCKDERKGKRDSPTVRGEALRHDVEQAGEHQRVEQQQRGGLLRLLVPHVPPRLPRRQPLLVVPLLVVQQLLLRGQNSVPYDRWRDMHPLSSGNLNRNPGSSENEGGTGSATKVPASKHIFRFSVPFQTVKCRDMCAHDNKR